MSTEIPVEAYQKTNLVLLVSDGTKIEPIWKYTQEINPKSRIAIIISHKEKPKYFPFAQKRGIQTETVPRYIFPGESKESYSKRLAERVYKYLPKNSEGELLENYLIISAGLRYILGNRFLSNFDPDKMINLHPGLLPEKEGDEQIILENGVKVDNLAGFYDDELFKETLRRNLKWCGVSIHYMINKVDSGSIIMRAAVPISTGDDIKSLADRVHKKEDEILPVVLDKLLRSKMI